MNENYRSMTLLNEMGDVEIAWDEDKDDEMRAIIEKKMAEGVRFFILKPVLGSFLHTKKQVKKVSDIPSNHVKIMDSDIEAMFSAGKIALFRNESGGTIETAGVAKDAATVAKSRTVGVKAMQGG